MQDFDAMSHLLIRNSLTLAKLTENNSNIVRLAKLWSF